MFSCKHCIVFCHSQKSCQIWIPLQRNDREQGITLSPFHFILTWFGLASLSIRLFCHLRLKELHVLVCFVVLGNLIFLVYSLNWNVVGLVVIFCANLSYKLFHHNKIMIRSKEKDMQYSGWLICIQRTFS